MSVAADICDPSYAALQASSEKLLRNGGAGLLDNSVGLATRLFRHLQLCVAKLDKAGTMRVLVWQWGRYGGGPRYALELSAALRVHCKMTTILSMAQGAEVLDHASHRSKVDIPIATYSGKLDFVTKTLTVGALMRRVANEISSAKPDVAINTMPAYWDAFFVPHLERMGIPIVTMIHDATVHPGDRFPLVQSLQRRMVKASSAIVALSEFVAGRLRQRSWWPGRLQATIPHVCFDLSELQLPPASVPASSQGRPLRLLLAGRLKAYKGLELFNAALDALPTGSVTVRIAGAVDDPSAIAALAAKHPVELQLGWLSDSDFVSNLDWCDVLVLPYVEASQSGVIPLAYARARPVVVTPVGGLPGQVAHETSGLIATDVSGGAVAATIMRLASQPELLQTCAEGALRLARGPLSWQQIAPQFADVLAKVAARNSLRTTA